MRDVVSEANDSQRYDNPRNDIPRNKFTSIHVYIYIRTFNVSIIETFRTGLTEKNYYYEPPLVAMLTTGTSLSAYWGANL